jgi:rhamnogalacturonyl hydrolase YesR
MIANLRNPILALIAGCAALPVLAVLLASAMGPLTQVPANQPQDRSNNILATMERAADWELAHPDLAAVPPSRYKSTDPLNWVVAAFTVGLTALADRSSNPRYGEAILSAGAQHHWGLGPRAFHADDYEIAQSWVWAYQHKHDPSMIAAVRQRFDAIVAAHPSGSLLMVPVADSNGGCFRRWCWCDALFMGPPGWAALAQATGDGRYQAYADKEYRATTALLFDPDQALYYRDSSYFGKTGPHGEKIFWSRGNGWVYAGLARILTILPADSPSRPYYQDLFLTMSRRIVTLQKANGSWAPSLLDPRKDTLPETSGTGFFTYGLAWGVHAGLLKDPVYRRAAERGWSLLTKAVQADGKLGWVQQVGSGPDSVAADYTQPFGVGAFLLAGTAMLDMTGRR